MEQMYHVSIAEMQNRYLSGKTNEVRNDSTVSFQEVLDEELNKKQVDKKGSITFSKHANERLAKRNITLTGEQVMRLQNGVNQAKEKGIKESLIMMDNLSFIVNVKNDTVVTALDTGFSDQNVFTNIDGAVII